MLVKCQQHINLLLKHVQNYGKTNTYHYSGNTYLCIYVYTYFDKFIWMLVNEMLW